MDPLTWAWLALMIGSAGASYAGQKKVGHEREKAMAAAAIQREAQSKRGEAAAKSTADQLLATKDNEKAKAAEIEASYKQPQAVSPAGQQLPTAMLDVNAPKGSTTVQEANRVGGVNRAFNDKQNTLAAKLSAFGDVMLGNQIVAKRNSQDINMAQAALGNYNQYVLPAAMNAANQSGKQWSTAADVMKLAAAVMGPYALGTTPPASTVTPITQAEVLSSMPQLDWGALVNQQVGVPNYL